MAAPGTPQLRLPLRCSECLAVGEATMAWPKDGSALLPPGKGRGFSALILPAGWETSGDGGEVGTSGELVFECPRCVAKSAREMERADEAGVAQSQRRKAAPA